ncbi:MAG: hypothetical protein JXR79_00405 [Nitrospirae bacterium]|nr:hypothetical protein [Nitrospirota bacterium]
MRIKFTVGVLLLVLCFVVQPVIAGELPSSFQPIKQEKKTIKSQKTVETQKSKYPPYPDVWDWQMPEADKSNDPSSAPIIKVHTMDNGDVMIAYALDYKPDMGKVIVKYFTFFGKIGLSDMEAKTVYKENYTGDAKTHIPFRNIFFLSKIGIGMRGGGCYDALGHHISIYDKTETKSLESKTLLYVFDKPKYYKTRSHCWDGPSFYYRVKAVDAAFLPLKDGTFLVITDVGYIIRFDENFQTKSNLINNKFFWMDDKEFRTFEAKYGDRAVGHKDSKQLYADLYKLLMNIKRRAVK